MPRKQEEHEGCGCAWITKPRCNPKRSDKTRCWEVCCKVFANMMAIREENEKQRQWLQRTTGATMRSDLRCVGSTMHSRACLFENVCYAHGSFFFYRRGRSAHDGLMEQVLVGRDHATLAQAPISLANLVSPAPARFSAVTMNELAARPFNITGVDDFLPAGATLFTQPFVYYSSTMHWYNPGHLIFENFLPIYVALESWQLTPSRAVLFNGCRRSCPDAGSLAEKFARSVFNDYVGLQSFNAMAAGKAHCFSSLLVGTGGETTAGLHGGAAFHMPSLLRMRSDLLRSSGINASDHGVPRTLRVLILNKTKGHGVSKTFGNIVENLAEVPRAIQDAYPTIRVTVIEPQRVNLFHQAQLFSSSMIVMCPWGGISMLNWLMPPGAFELLLTSFRAGKGLSIENHRDRLEKMRGPGSLARGLPCPDWDYRYHDGVPHITTLRYCTAAPKRGIDTVLNITALMSVIHNAIHRLAARHDFDNIRL